MRKLWVTIATLVVMIIAGISYVYSYYSDMVQVDVIYPGIYINEVDVGDLGRKDAVAKLEKDDHYINKEMTITYDGYEYQYAYKDLGYNPDYKNIVDRAYRYGKDGESKDRLKNIIDLQRKPLHLEVTSEFDEEKIDEIIENLSEHLDIPSKDATFDIVEGEIKVTEEQVGRQIDRQKLKENIYLSDPEEPIEISMIELTPKVKAADFKDITGVIGEYSTNYSSSIQARKDNIKKSAQILDGTVLMPGEEFSFNDTIGEISVDTGFFEATVIEGGEFVSGAGGGICQTSTTLYMAVSKADLDINERHNHSRPINYVPRGLDAAVARGLLDLRFTNPFEFPIYIIAKADDDDIKFEIIGNDKVKDYDVEIVVEQTETLSSDKIEKKDSSLPKGKTEVTQGGYGGSVYQSYKIKSKNGEEISKDKYYRSRYPARDTIITIGTGENTDE